jgi:ribA/ribD-fused uncharacterized protein
MAAANESNDVLPAPCSKKRSNDWQAALIGVSNKKATAGVAKARTIYFYKAHHPFGCFSNWSEHGLTHKGIWFASSEQAYAWEKAMKFDPSKCAGIMAETMPWEIKRFGGRRNIRKFKEKVWDAFRYEVMLNILIAKFSQNSDILAVLLGTGAAELVEASEVDDVWGIGFSASRAEANRGRWGRNLLGNALMEARVQLGGLAVSLEASAPALPAAASANAVDGMCMNCNARPKHPGFEFCVEICENAWTERMTHAFTGHGSAAGAAQAAQLQPATLSSDMCYCGKSPKRHGVDQYGQPFGLCRRFCPGPNF